MKFNTLANSILKEEVQSNTLYLLALFADFQGQIIYGVYDSKENARKALLQAIKEDPDDKEDLKVISVPLNPSEPSYRYTSNGQEVDMSYEGWDLDGDTKDAFRGVADQV
jgi:hypothetical protein